MLSKAYAAVQNLKFSTDINPAKCKTKTLAFLKTNRVLPNLTLCGNPLPWTDKCKHLGTIITNRIDGCEEDMRVKNAKYIGKNIELNQEFFFAHPETKIKVNQIYNSSYYSSPLCDLFGNGARKLESSYNRSVKIMLGLPYNTHRCLIEPLTDIKHVKKLLITRFLGFMENIKKNKKEALKMLMNTAMEDVRSVTGKNYREIMLLTGKTSVYDVTKMDADKIEYFNMEKKDLWKVDIIKEIIDVKSKIANIDNFNTEELETVLTYLCTS